ncbi:MAG TPA: universal stress protein [Pirellulales bacterium]|jgi:nucleotide-binding universal stress UspA family protein|nr:universal stress protein [Pirellulales bacterium]
MISIQRILVPTDFSEPSLAALKYGRAFAESFGATLRLLHVIEDSLVSWPDEGAGIVTPMTTFEEIESEVRRRLESSLSPDDRLGIKVELITARGAASNEIVAYALNEQIDLVIMGTHGRKPAAHLLMGSVAEKVVRKAPCPVLIVRHPEHEFIVP